MFLDLFIYNTNIYLFCDFRIINLLKKTINNYLYIFTFIAINFI